MALVINDRVKETTTTTGTGAVSLGGAVTGFETFAAGIGNSNTVYYCIAHQDQAEFEVGLGTLDGDSSDLTRTTVISSSNSDSAVDFSAGTKDVFCTIPASKMVFEDGSNDVTIGRNLTVTGDLTISGDDLTMATNTSGAALIGDGSNFNPVVISGDVSIATNGAASLAAAQTNITSILATDLKIGEDDQTKIDFETADEIHFYAANAEQVFVSDGVFGPQTDSDVDLGTNSVRFKDAYVDSVTVTGDVSVGDDLTVNGGVVEVKNTGAQSEVRFYCESSNAHYAAIKAPAHSDFSGNTTLTLPATTDTIAGIASTQTFTNKTITNSNNTVGLATLDIDGGTDIGANLADADLFIVDDGAGGTNRKMAASRIATYVGASAGAFAIANLDIDGGTDIGAALADADLIVVDDGAGGTNRKAALSRVKTYIGDPTALAIALG
jgi:hypothetical protein